MKHVRCVGLLALLAAVAIPLPVRAQMRITGGITGTVTDPSNAVIPGAFVVLKDEATGATKETVTSGSGLFSFPDINHGLFSVTVKLEGFQTAVVNKTLVEAGRTTDVNVKLRIGS